MTDRADKPQARGWQTNQAHRESHEQRPCGQRTSLLSPSQKNVSAIKRRETENKGSELKSMDLALMKLKTQHPMSKTRDLINAHLLPLLATVSTGTLVGILFIVDAGLSNLAQNSQKAKNHNECVYTIMNIPSNQRPGSIELKGIAGAVRYCNGG